VAAAVGWLSRKPSWPANPQADDVKSAAYLTWAEWGPDARIPRDERLASVFPSVPADERKAWMDAFARIGGFIGRVAQHGAEKGWAREQFALSIRREFPFMNDDALDMAWFLARYYAWHDGWR
jgi:hypothetical protein